MSSNQNYNYRQYMGENHPPFYSNTPSQPNGFQNQIHPTQRQPSLQPLHQNIPSSLYGDMGMQQQPSAFGYRAGPAAGFQPHSASNFGANANPKGLVTNSQFFGALPQLNLSHGAPTTAQHRSGYTAAEHFHDFPPQPANNSFMPGRPQEMFSRQPARVETMSPRAVPSLGREIGPLTWQQTVFCDNVDASSIPVPLPKTKKKGPARFPTPPPTQTAGNPYAPKDMPTSVHMLNHLLNGTQPPSRPDSSIDLPTQPPPRPRSTIGPPTQNEKLPSPPGSPVPVIPVIPLPRLGSFFSAPADGSSDPAGADADGSLDPAGADADGSLDQAGADTDGSLDPAGADAEDGNGNPPVPSISCISRFGAAEKSLARATARMKRKALNEVIAEFQKGQEDRIAELAEKHGVSVRKFKKLAGSSQHHLRTRTNSAWDAILHAKSQELNEGKPKGQRAGINAIRRAAKRDKGLMAAKKDSKKLKPLMDDLEAHQQQKKDAAKVSNKLGSSRATKLLRDFDKQFMQLHEATEISGFGIFTRGTYETTVKPYIVGNGPVREFFKKYFKKEVFEVALLFEGFVTEYNKVGNRPLRNDEKSRETVRIILESLRNITGQDRMLMNYVNYNTKIVAKYKIDIIGWPASVPKKSPRDLTDGDSISALYEAWSSGAAYWVKLSEKEYKKFMDKLKSDIAAGISVEPGRQKRSDAGGSHAKPSKKRQRSSQGASQVGPSKRQKTGDNGKKRSVVSHEEEEEEEEEHDDNDDDDKDDDSEEEEEEEED